LAPSRVPFTTVLWLLVACAVPRGLLWLVYGPVQFPDTGTYMTLARQIHDLDFSGYTGARTPVYPLLLVLTRFDPWVTWLIQSALGIATAAGLFLAAARSGSPPTAAALAAGASVISLNQLFWEANVLNETLAAFLIAASLPPLVGLARGPARLTTGLGLGAVCGLAALTRPMYVYLGPLYLALIALALGRRASRAMLGVTCGFGVLVLGWAGFNHATVGQFGLSTLVGYNLSQHSGGFIERAPDRYAAIRETYLRHRQGNLENGLTHSMVIWSAREEIKRQTGLSDPQLSAELARMSVDLFARNPHLYLASVLRAWSRFWTVPEYWDADRIASPTLRRALLVSWTVQRWLLVAANVAMLALAVGCVILRAGPLKRRDHWLHLPVVAIVIVLAGSAVQAFLEFGENGRYAVPTQPLVIVTLVLAAHAVLQIARGRSSARTGTEDIGGGRAPVLGADVDAR